MTTTLLFAAGTASTVRTRVTSSARGQHIPPLTSLRFFAAMQVVLFHSAGLWIGGLVFIGHDSGPAGWLARVVDRIVMSGYMAVSFFFVLSGFILAYVYLDLQGKLRGDRRAFYVARIARVYPAYLVALAVAILPLLWELAQTAPADGSLPMIVFMTLTMVQAWLPFRWDIWDPPAWSLSAEALFYLLFPFVVVRLARLQPRQLFIAAGVIWLVSFTMPALEFSWQRVQHHAATTLTSASTPQQTLGAPDQPGNSTGLFLVNDQTVIRFNAFAHLPEFLFGIVIGRLFTLARKRGAEARGGQRRWSGAWAAGALIAIGITLACIPLLGRYQYFSYTGLLCPLWALLISSLARNRGALARLLSSPMLVMLGEASYSLYLLHYPLLNWLTHFVRLPSEPGVYGIAVAALYIGGTLSCSVLSFRFIETPARRMIRGLAGRRSTNPIASHAE